MTYQFSPEVLARIEELVAMAPPLTPEQQMIIRRNLAPAAQPDTQEPAA